MSLTLGATRLRFPPFVLSRSVKLSEIADAICEFLEPIRLPNWDAEGNRVKDGVLRRWAVNLSGHFGSRRLVFWSKKRRDQFLSLLSRAAPQCNITRTVFAYDGTADVCCSGMAQQSLGWEFPRH